MPDQKFTRKTPEEIIKAVTAQKELCRKEGLPLFAPANGRCWTCHRIIYQNYMIPEGEPKQHISFGRDGANLVTECPHCGRSFCE